MSTRLSPERQAEEEIKWARSQFKQELCSKLARSLILECRRRGLDPNQVIIDSDAGDPYALIADSGGCNFHIDDLVRIATYLKVRVRNRILAK